jgi:pimeloyl-ACP methyl ester carboxylesterase
VATFCLLHGAWHDPSCWDTLAERLEALGHAATAPELPLHDPTAGYERRIRPALDALEDVSDPLVVLAHSQSSALAPLVAAARPVSLLVYLCPRMGSFEPPPAAPAHFRDGVPFPGTRPDGTSVWEPDVAIEAIYGRLPAEAARRLAARLRPMAMPPGDYPLQEHPDVAAALIYAAEDEFFEPAFERFMAREFLGVDPIELPGGHFPMAEDPDALARVLDRLARP